MPVVYANPTYPWQVSFGGQQAPTTQLNFRQMLSEVTDWNPNIDPQTAGRWINNAYRAIIDKRSWYGLKLKGQVSVQGPTTNGQVVCTQGSPFVTGIGTTWDATLIGLQFRTGFTFNYQTITNVMSPTNLQLDTPFAGAPGTNTTGYQILQLYIDFGMNIKRFLWCMNQQMGWPMEVNWPVETINAWDVWRQSLGWSKYMATRSPSPTGGTIMECWPSPFSPQVFPFEAYQQPPDLVLDSDAPVAWIPADLIVLPAVCNAVLRPGKYQNLQAYTLKRTEYKERLEAAELADNDLDQRDVSWDYGQEEGRLGTGIGSAYAQSHD